MKITERWKAVVGYEGLYEVSDLGNVRSLNYLGNTRKTKVLRPGDNGKGYLKVYLYKNGKRKILFVHRLVAESFIGPILKGMVINHINEDKTDNRVSNLEIVTQKQNSNHGTRNERIGKAHSKQLDLIEADWPYHEYTFMSSIKAGEFFNYKRKDTVGSYISLARKRGENFINIRKKKYFFAQQQ